MDKTRKRGRLLAVDAVPSMKCAITKRFRVFSPTLRNFEDYNIENIAFTKSFLLILRNVLNKNELPVW